MSVYIDGSYSFSISEEDYLKQNLYEKREITSAEIEDIINNVNFRSAKSTAVKYLSLKVRTRKEVCIKLENEGFDSRTIEKAVDEIQSIGYINDKIFTQKYLYDRSKLKPIAKRMIKFELQNKGVSDEIIDEVLQDWEVDEVVLAESLARRKFGKYDIGDEKTIRKIFSFLQHRGFGFRLIEEVIGKLKEMH